MRGVIKIYHFTRFPEYFMDRDHFLQSQKVINIREKCNDLAGTTHTATKGKITYVGCIAYLAYYFGSVVDFFLKFRNFLWSMNAFIHSGPNYLSVPYWYSLLPKKFGNCVHEVTVPWFLYALLTLCSSAAVENRPFPSINTPFPPFFFMIC